MVPVGVSGCDRADARSEHCGIVFRLPSLLVTVTVT